MNGKQCVHSISHCAPVNVRFPFVHLLIICFHLYTYICEVYFCAHTYMKFPFVHIHTLLRPMCVTGKLNEGNAKTETCGWGHMQYMMLIVNLLEKLYFA